MPPRRALSAVRDGALIARVQSSPIEGMGGIAGAASAGWTYAENASAEGDLRRLLLPREPAVRARPRGALRDVPATGRAAAATPAAAVRVPPRASLARGVGVP